MNEKDIEFFKENGYLHIPQAFDLSLVKKWRKMVNMNIANTDSNNPFNQAIVKDFNSSSFRSELQSISETFPVKEVQISTRFPEEKERFVVEGHIDGIHYPANHIKIGEFKSFNSLVGVYLSPAQIEKSGRLMVWPGTHKKISKYVSEFGVDRLIYNKLDIEKPNPQPINVSPGDAILLHYLTLHAPEFNLSSDIRYALYFRLKSSVNRNKYEAVKNLWKEWKI